MRVLSKCIAVAMSALFAATPVVPASAMPLSVPKVQQQAGGGDILLVQESRQFRDREREIYWPRNRPDSRNWRGRDRDRHTGWRDRSDRGVGWRNRDDRRNNWRGRDDRRHGWYRGHRGYRYHRPGYRYHDGFWFPLAAFGVGTIIGGAIANDRGYVGGGSAHVNWCSNRYRSYRAYDNTFQPYNGPRRQCVSPYR